MIARRYAELELKKFGIAFWWLQLYTPKDVTLHLDGCNFAFWWLQLCILMVATLHLDGCNFTSWWLQLYILMVATLHLDVCNFASWWLQLYTPKDVTLHPNGCFFAWLPPLICLEAKFSIFFFLILNELHSAAGNFTFLTRINCTPYENTLHSLREYTSFFTRIHFILVRNVVGSRIESKILSAGNKYFPGLKILYSRLENIAINGRNKIKAISMGI